MAGIYEARVETDCGTYRAFLFGTSTICVTEDGVDGVVDYMPVVTGDPTATSPEALVPALLYWVCEMVRGATPFTAVLTRRED